MIFLDSFRLPSRREEENFFDVKNPAFKTKNFRTCYTTKYPFGLFAGREFPELAFDDITIFCGDNGSGKSTLLNLIAEKLELERSAPYNRSDFFDDYTELCDCTLDREPPSGSRIITSDGVFEKVLDIRRLNEGIDGRREELIKEFVSERNNEEPNALRGLDDYDRWRKVSDIRRKKTTQSQYIRSRLMRNVQERSNGESALAFFVDSIADGALYLLDEPENSLSPSNQLELKLFIEDSVRNHGCQFVISTHSPFMLSLRRAKIYDIDSAPVRICGWTSLDCVRVYYDFFNEHKDDFH